MDPILFKSHLQPLSIYDKYDIHEILKICCPLRGIWDWSMTDCASKSILRIFKLVHLEPNKYLKVEPDWITDIYFEKGIDDLEYDERWCICWDKEQPFKTSYLYKSLEDLLEESENSNTPDWDDYGTSSS